ncbi:DUF6779 domain-containing protein [Mycobacterium sp.]|uniref:DUF6779 domain-containing protein n=1 Tax=Mycobacterium sp. TaxID=1785 RepID=UPI0012739AE6|nr:DUF6779 domain-containing protein [Mycobacterium sp.]KAA8970422.1 MAG: hypothetical protein F6Q13_00170 [Mycobacterium sp.]
MTVLSRGARVRRGGRRPGWLLLTTLLVLAIAASSALVFTNRVELLKLAVILALWAAIGAAFVSVIYRRQSDWDQARVRDLKLVYDLQLDREISARREYELTVESQLRRELASELSAQAADEVAALRAELAALRTNLEILFDAELAQPPALEFDRASARSHSDWDRDSRRRDDRVSRVTAVRAEEPGRAEDTSIIDVPEEPLVPPPPPGGHAYQGPEEASRGADTYPPPWAQPGGRWAPPERQSEPPPQHQRPSWAKPDEPPRHRPPAADWQPAGADGLWLPPGVAASDYAGKAPDSSADVGQSATMTSEPKLAAPPPAERRGRHSVPAEPGPAMPPPAEPVARHRGADSPADPGGLHAGGESVAQLLARLQADSAEGGRRRRHAQ